MNAQVTKIFYLLVLLSSIMTIRVSYGQSPMMMGSMMQGMAIPQGLYTSQCEQYEALGKSMCPTSLPSGVVHNSCTPERMKAEYPEADKHGPEYTYQLQLYCTKKEVEKETAQCEADAKKFTGRLTIECELEEKQRQEHEASMQRFQSMFQIMMMCKSGGKMDCALAAAMSMMQISEANEEMKQQMRQNELRKQLQADLTALSEKYNPKPIDPGPPKPPAEPELTEVPASTDQSNLQETLEDILNSGTTDGTQTSENGSAQIVPNNGNPETAKTETASVAALLQADPKKVSKAIEDGTLTADSIASGDLPKSVDTKWKLVDPKNMAKDQGTATTPFSAALVSGGSKPGESSSSNRYSLSSNKQTAAGGFSFYSPDEINRFTASLPENSNSSMIHTETGGGLEFLLNRVGLHFTARMMRARDKK